MADNELIDIICKYQEKEMEIERNYNIKKEALEKDYQNQKQNNRIQLLNSLFKKEESLHKDLEGIKRIRNILNENEDKKGIQELKDMLNESQVNLVHNDILLREEKDIQIQENNGMKPSKKEESEEIEDIDKGPKNNEFEKKKKDYPMTDRKRKRPPQDNNN